MLKIGLTGGIGSGKSTVAAIFRVLGIPVFQADLVARTLMETDQGLQKALRNTFGEAVFQEGRLDRKYLADLVFTDPYQLDLLNAIVHPVTIQAADDWAKQQTAPYVVKEAALFFEAGSAIGFDYMIGVSSPQTLRIHRVMQRDGVSRDEVLSRMKRQIQESIKMRLCDFVILNDEQHLLIPQVLTLHERFLKESKTEPYVSRKPD
ncbi:MAG: dephospho-CoA kinase [Bacteroidota bacterium]|nr:dephospho-CoA kinase [Bacteroidota bacterium]